MCQENLVKKKFNFFVGEQSRDLGRPVDHNRKVPQVGFGKCEHSEVLAVGEDVEPSRVVARGGRLSTRAEAGGSIATPSGRRYESSELAEWILYNDTGKVLSVVQVFCENGATFG